RVEAPALHAGLGVQRNEYVRGRLEVEKTECEDGCYLEGHLAGGREPRPGFSGTVSPGDLQVLDILTVDLVQTREALPEHVAAVVAPVAGVRCLCASNARCHDHAGRDPDDGAAEEVHG